MSMTAQLHSLEKAHDDACCLRQMFWDGHLAPKSDDFDKWEIAGSIRRGRREVGDVDHVVVPRFSVRTETVGLFAETREIRVNRVLARSDQLVGGEHETNQPEGETKDVNRETIGLDNVDRFLKPKFPVTKFIDENGRARWGDRQRTMLYRGLKHEIWMADELNFGSVLAIRTGPWEFSQKLVVALQRNGYINHHGYVRSNRDWFCSCGWAGELPTWENGLLAGAFFQDENGRRGGPFSAKCPNCSTTSQTALQMRVVPAGDERAYFALCGLTWVEPSRRLCG